MTTAIIESTQDYKHSVNVLAAIDTLIKHTMELQGTARAMKNAGQLEETHIKSMLPLADVLADLQFDRRNLLEEIERWEEIENYRVPA